MKIIYSPEGKATTATDEDAVEMIKHCGYSETDTPQKKSSPRKKQPEIIIDLEGVNTNG
jgi:hypothetical protein